MFAAFNVGNLKGALLFLVKIETNPLSLLPKHYRPQMVNAVIYFYH